MSYEEGMTFDEMKKKTTDKFVIESKRLTLVCLIKMIFKDNIFHADCHNGNLLYNTRGHSTAPWGP
jgi:predicted unusual protein kinase regulating ubiquinone biosynthesis (AarF/ABC1/UbiB family)